MLFVLLLLLAVMILFATEWLSPDIIVLIAICLLVFSGTITSNEAFQGFGNDFIVMLIAIFIIGGVLKHNGIIEYLLDKIDNLPTLNLTMLIALTMLITAFLSAFMNNTAVASVFIAPLIGLSKKFKVSPSKLLMPMAFASLMGGTCTLIGTSTNVAGSSFLAQKGIEPIGMFELLPVTLPIIVLGILFMATIGKKMLPNFQPEEMQTEVFLRRYLSEVIVNEKSPAIGANYLEFCGKFDDIKFDELVRNGEIILPTFTTYIELGDILLLQIDKEKLLNFITTQNFSVRQASDSKFNLNEEMEMLELMVLPNSYYLGKAASRMLQQRNISVVAIHRKGESLKGNLDAVRLKIGDMLMVVTTQQEMEMIKKNANFEIISHHDKSSNVNLKKGFGILLLFGIAVILGSLKIIPISIAFIITALAAYLMKAIPQDALMKSVDWRLLILIGGMSAFGIALTNTGGDKYIAEIVTNLLSPYGNYALLAGFMIITVLLTQPMSNAASVLVVLPIAIQSAIELGLNPRPFAIAVIVSASISMIAPFEPASLLVFAPGRYKIIDFIKVGGVVTVIALVIILFTVPMVYEF